ncbi:MAG: 1-acyl-sn-glycerol-3-phosphate acyltransferase [Spartobacteria bacterium]|nr:1-acyl-sn-glycerol-3-phosphate acyltransferase [Spartobacteria bacterium]
MPSCSVRRDASAQPEVFAGMINFLTCAYLNIVFYTGFILFTVLGTPLMVLCVLPFALSRPRRDAMALFRRAICWYGNVITFMARPFVRVRCKNLETENLSPPYIIVCNHRSASDGFMMASLPSAGIDTNAVQVVNAWPFRIPVLGWFARGAGYLSITEMSFDDFTARATQLLEEGVNIISFPEGTRSGTGGMGPFHSGIFRLALQTGVPIVMCCISGNEHIPRKGSLTLHPGNITILRLPALLPQHYQNLSVMKLKNRVWETMNQTLARLDKGGL